jgi:hypothetical protein
VFELLCFPMAVFQPPNYNATESGNLSYPHNCRHDLTRDIRDEGASFVVSCSVVSGQGIAGDLSGYYMQQLS